MSIFGQGTALTLLLTATLAPQAPGRSPAPRRAVGGVGELGTVVEYEFKRPPIGEHGIASLADLRGKPVLIEFWGTRCPPCVGGAVPASLALQETHGDDLQVVLVEAQGSPPEAVERFAITKKWMGGRALWTSEAPLQVSGSSLPKFALLDRGGRLVLTGNPIAQARDIERLVQEEIRCRRVPTSDVPKVVRPAWTEFLKGQGARALELLDAVEAAAQPDPDAADALVAARAAREQFRRHWDLRFRRIERLLAAGAVGEAASQLAALEPVVAGIEGCSERIRTVRRSLESEELRKEAEAERLCSRILSRFHASGGDPDVAQELQSFAERHPGTQAARRAARVAGLGCKPPR